MGKFFDAFTKLSASAGVWLYQVIAKLVDRGNGFVASTIAPNLGVLVAWVQRVVHMFIAWFNLRIATFRQWLKHGFPILSTKIVTTLRFWAAQLKGNVSVVVAIILVMLYAFADWVKHNVPILIAKTVAAYQSSVAWAGYNAPILVAKSVAIFKGFAHWVQSNASFLIASIGLKFKSFVHRAKRSNRNVSIVKKLTVPRIKTNSWYIAVKKPNNYALPLPSYHFNLKYMRFFMLDSIKNKLRLAFMSMAGLFVAMGFLAVSEMNVINQQSTEIEKNWLPSVVVTNAINAATGDLRIWEALHVLATDPAEMARHELSMQQVLKEISDLRTKYEPLISSAEEKAKYVAFSKEYDAYLEASRQSMALSRQNKNAEAAAQLKLSANTYDSMSNLLVDLVKLNQDGAVTASHKGDLIYADGQKMIFAASFLVTVLAIFLMWYFEKIVSHPLGQITGVIKQLAGGDVSASQLFQNRVDEIGQTAKSVGAITQTLKLLTSDSLEIIGSIQAGTLSVRADVAKHPGEFGEILKGMNKLLDVLNKPLAEISNVMQQFALGNLKTNMQGAYEGDLRALKANVNRSLDALVSLFGELSDVSARLSNGDLTKTVTGSYQGDFASLKNNMNNVIAQLSASLKTIVANTASISSGVMETNKTSMQVAEQSSQQMSAIVEMANAVTETSASIRMISENAKRGNELAGSTAQLAETGLQQLNKLVEVIEQISTEYNRIEQITGKITRIADKTHLLSLNAGLEAVRAGEHGLGFGFVAQQIGKLAEEASIAARDIGNLITGSMQSVRISVTGSRETRSAMQQIANAAQESGVAVQAISIALGQQSTAVEWISEKVRKVQSSSEANAVSAKEISQTMAHLTKTVEQTNTQVQRFTLS